MASWSLSLRRSVSGPSVSALQSSVPLFREMRRGKDTTVVVVVVYPVLTLN